MAFEKMSKGWAHGSKPFKKALVNESRKERARVALGNASTREAMELSWEAMLEECLSILDKSRCDVSVRQVAF